MKIIIGAKGRAMGIPHRPHTISIPMGILTGIAIPMVVLLNICVELMYICQLYTYQSSAMIDLRFLFIEKQTCSFNVASLIC